MGTNVPNPTQPLSACTNIMGKTLAQDLTALFSQGKDKVHVISDFDGTLTCEYLDGQKTPSLISILRRSADYLDSDYQKAAYALYEQYHPIEINPNLPLPERKAKMREWWIAHYRLLFKHGLHRHHLDQIINSGFLKFRQGAKDFLKITHTYDIPVIIFSASVSGEALKLYCEREGVLFSNLHFLVNDFEWNDAGFAVNYCEPIITSLNKDETVLTDFPHLNEQIRHRPNALLFGNNLGDLGMAKGSKLAREVSIALTDPEEGQEKIATLNKEFDHILQSDYVELNSALLQILKK